MFQLVYFSQETVAFSPAQLSELLAKARQTNQTLGITGMLVHQGGKFLQVLEGDEPAVRTLVQKIAADSRHTGMVELHECNSDRRDFPDWSMAFRNLDLTEDAAPGFNPFLESTLSIAQFVSDPPRAKMLLLMFKDGLPLGDAVGSLAS